MIITIDGPAAAGKGTLARRLAGHLGFAYLDTGAIYRAVGLRLLREGHDPADTEAATEIARRLDPADLADPALRTDAVARAASRVAAIPAVRAALLDFQRGFAQSPPDGRPGAVLDGRDAGTVVCPDADVKLFVTASAEVRAERRFRELREQGAEVIKSSVLRDMQERDARDAARDVAPLKPADDAVIMDTSDMDADAAFHTALDLILSRS